MTAGRHRSFNKDNALEKAMIVFWQNGYTGTSLTDLTSAMGINKPSLYSAFGNKEELFNQAIALYLEKHGLIHSALLINDQQGLMDRLTNYLLSIAQMLTDKNLPKGCLLCNSTTEVAGSRLPDNSSAEVSSINQQTVAFLTDFFENEKLAGNYAPKHESETMANYLLALQFGLAVSARNGSDMKELTRIIDFSVGSFN